MSKEWDYTVSSWGHAAHMFEWDEKKEGVATLLGHGPHNGRMVVGDHIIMAFGSGPAKFKIIELSYFLNPKDMWSGKIESVCYVNEPDVRPGQEWCK